jgi:MAF protein
MHNLENLMTQLILASASPRRRELLAVLGLPFVVQTADIDESTLPDEAPEPHARRLAETKAITVAAKSGEAVVLACDTIVVQHGQILGKPRDVSAAREMLRSLREAPHRVITAVALALPQARSVSLHPIGTDTPEGSPRVLYASHSSDVTMRSYSDPEIDIYIASGDPMDKAGAYAIQNRDFEPVAHFNGCFASIMGLPLGVVADLLKQAGFGPAPNWPAQCAAFAGTCCQGIEDGINSQ